MCRATSDPRIGNALFRIDCDRLLGGAYCFVFVGTRKSQIPLVGVNVLVDPASWIVMVPIRAGGATGVPGAPAGDQGGRDPFVQLVSPGGHTPDNVREQIAVDVRRL